MRVSINIGNYSWPGGVEATAGQLAGVARAADESGLDAVWTGDHLLQADPFAPASDTDILEASTTLGFLAAQTRRIELGAMVAAVTFRAPALLIKAVTTLDVLSGGRAWFGIGAGYLEDEARAMGLPMPPAPERFERLEETLQLALRMWAGDESRFLGRHYQLERPQNSPSSIRRPRPPIVVGGHGEGRTLPLVARYADACNLFDVPDGGLTISRKLDVLAQHCAAIGRPYADIEKTVSTRFNPDDAHGAFAAHCDSLAALGIEHVVVLAPRSWTRDLVHRLAEETASLRSGPDEGR